MFKKIFWDYKRSFVGTLYN